MRRKQGKNSRIAMLAASLLTLVAISCGSLGLWRLGSDLDWAGDFVISRGLLSHWQVWIGTAIAVQYGAWRLTRYARQAHEQEPCSKPKKPHRSRYRQPPTYKDRRPTGLVF